MKKVFFFALFISLLSQGNTHAQISKRWYSYLDYQDAMIPSVTINYSYFTLWNTANSIDHYGSGVSSTYDTNQLISTAMSFAPRISAWNDVATFGSTIKVGPGDVFVIDSVRVAGQYKRNNTKPLVRDTLRFVFVNGNGASTTNLPNGYITTAHYGTTNFPVLSHDTVKNIAGRAPGVSTAPYVQSIIFGPTDTASFFNRAYALTTPYTVPAGYIAATSMTFKSGDASFVPYDTIEYLSGAYKYGSFRPILGHNSLSGSTYWAPYDPLDSNVGYFVKKPYASWPGLYVPTWAWTNGGGPADFQYPAIDFHITCTTCELNDAITGTFSVCASSTVTLAHSAPGGTWSSSNTSIASASGTSGIITGVAAGTVTITYAIGSNKAYRTFTVHASPTPGTITGPSDICHGSITAYTTSGSGGVWSSSTPSIASVSSGVVSAIAIGTATISYIATTSFCGTAYTTKPVTVNALPDAGTLTGATSVCVGSSTALASTSPGGSWSATSGNATVSSSGSVTGVTTGSDVIVYTFTNFCGTSAAAHAVSVNPLPVVGTTSGFSSVCIGSNITLTNTEAGGTWSAGNANATVNTAGMVAGVAAGTVEITYTITNSCGNAKATTTITVNDCSSTGITDINGNMASISIFPNPTSGNLTITSSTAISNVTISNMIGQTVLSGNYGSDKVTINLETLPQGIYTVKINDSKVFKVTRQ